MGVKAKQRSIEKLCVAAAAKCNTRDVRARYLKAQGKMKPEEKKVGSGNTLQKGSKNQLRISKGGGKNLDGRLKKDKKTQRRSPSATRLEARRPAESRAFALCGTNRKKSDPSSLFQIKATRQPRHTSAEIALSDPLSA